MKGTPNNCGSDRPKASASPLQSYDHCSSPPVLITNVTAPRLKAEGVLAAHLLDAFV